MKKPPPVNGSGVYTIAYTPAVPGDAPDREEILRLRREATRSQLEAAGMKPWGVGVGTLMLIPGAWVNALPDELPVESIGGAHTTVGELRERSRKDPTTQWDDTRFECLAFGWRGRVPE